MGFIGRFIINLLKSAQRAYGRISPRARLQLAIVIGIIGLLAFGVGVYNTIDLTNKYNDMNAIPMPDADTIKNMSQADQLLVAQVGIAKRDLLTRKSQASSVIGAGAVMLGIATLIFVRLPEQPSPKSPPAPAPSTNSAPVDNKPSEAEREVGRDKTGQVEKSKLS